VRGALAVLATLLLASPAAAQNDVPADTATPDGAATLYPHWTGAVPSICYGDRRITSFTLRVGAGGKPGRVRLRIVRYDGDTRTGVRAAPWVDLPASPGDHRFPADLALGNCQTREDVALDQETGGHVIVHTYPPGNGDPHNDMSKLNELWVFRPPLADGATATPAEKRQAERLLMTWETEPIPRSEPPPPPPPSEPPPRSEPAPVQPAVALGGPARQRALRRGAVLVTVWSRTAGVVRVSVRIAPGITLRRTLTVRAGRELRARVPLTARARRALRRRSRTALVTLRAGDAVTRWRARLVR
jgi:hypothetical protein